MKNPLYTPVPGTDEPFDPKATPLSWDELKLLYNANQETVHRIDKAARLAGRMVGRIVQCGVADGYATYMIIRENKQSVRLQMCPGLGDDYMEFAWGFEATVMKSHWVFEQLDNEPLAPMLFR